MADRRLLLALLLSITCPAAWAQDGRELWSAPLPYAGIATPMTYLGTDGRQYVVIAAGGHGKSDLPVGDEVVAFALPAR